MVPASGRDSTLVTWPVLQNSINYWLIIHAKSKKNVNHP